MGLERLPQIVSIVRGGGRERGALPHPRLRPASGPRPTPGSASTPPRSGRGPFLPQLVLWGRGTTRRRLYGPGSQRKGEGGRECGRWQGWGPRPGKALSSSIPPSKKDRPGLSHRRDPRSRIKGSRGVRARPRVAQDADPPSRSRGSQRGRDPRGEQCSPGSGSCLLASSGIEGELVLELQQ